MYRQARKSLGFMCVCSLICLLAGNARLKQGCDLARPLSDGFDWLTSSIQIVIFREGCCRRRAPKDVEDHCAWSCGTVTLYAAE